MKLCINHLLPLLTLTLCHALILLTYINPYICLCSHEWLMQGSGVGEGGQGGQMPRPTFEKGGASPPPLFKVCDVAAHRCWRKVQRKKCMVKQPNNDDYGCLHTIRFSSTFSAMNSNNTYTMYKQMLPEVRKLLCLYLTVPVIKDPSPY